MNPGSETSTYGEEDCIRPSTHMLLPGNLAFICGHIECAKACFVNKDDLSSWNLAFIWGHIECAKACFVHMV